MDRYAVPDLDQLPGSAFLTRRQLAALVGCSWQNVKAWAAAGRGPKVTRIENSPRYRVSDVRAWLGEAK